MNEQAIVSKLEDIDNKLNDIEKRLAYSILPSKEYAVAQINNILAEKPEIEVPLRNCLTVIASCYPIGNDMSRDLHWFINNLSLPKQKTR